MRTKFHFVQWLYDPYNEAVFVGNSLHPKGFVGLDPILARQDVSCWYAYCNDGTMLTTVPFLTREHAALALWNMNRTRRYAVIPG